MDLALKAAENAGKSGEVPIGCVIVRDNDVTAAAGNRTLTDRDPTAHAEMLAIRLAAEVVGSERVDTNTPPLMGGEDFSFMLEARPGAFIFIGNGDSAGLHHPAYDFNDEAIPVGASFWARLVETAMPA